MLDFACFSRDKIVPLHRKEKSTTRDVGLEAFLILFSCDFVPFLSRLGFVSRNKISQVVGLQRVANGGKCKNALTTSNHQKGLRPQDKPVLIDKLEKEDQDLIRKYYPELFK